MAIAASAVALAAFGASAGLGASESPKVKRPVGLPLAAWTCDSPEGFNDFGPINVRFRNTTPWSISLASPKPADCAPWIGAQTPGQVNVAGSITDQTFPLLYDEMADSNPDPFASTDTFRTPLGITVHLDGAGSFTPDLALLRVVDPLGRYLTRGIVIRTPQGDACTGAESAPANVGAALTVSLNESV